MMETLKVRGQLLPVSHRPPQLVLVIYQNSKRSIIRDRGELHQC